MERVEQFIKNNIFVEITDFIRKLNTVNIEEALTDEEMLTKWKECQQRFLDLVEKTETIDGKNINLIALIPGLIQIYKDLGIIWLLTREELIRTIVWWIKREEEWSEAQVRLVIECIESELEGELD